MPQAELPIYTGKKQWNSGVRKIYAALEKKISI